MAGVKSDRALRLDGQAACGRPVQNHKSEPAMRRAISEFAIGRPTPIGQLVNRIFDDFTP